MTALKMAKHQHMTAYASKGTQDIYQPPLHSCIHSRHTTTILLKMLMRKAGWAPVDNSHLLQSTLMQSVVFFPRCPFLLKGLIYAEDLCKTWLMSRLTLDGRLGSLMNCMLCLRFDIEHVSVSLYVFITTYKHPFRVGLQGWYGAHNRFIDFAIFVFLNLQGMYTAKSTVQQLTAT